MIHHAGTHQFVGDNVVFLVEKQHMKFFFVFPVPQCSFRSVVLNAVGRIRIAPAICDFNTVSRYANGMFILRGKELVAGDSGPSIAQNFYRWFAQIQHRLNGEKSYPRAKPTLRRDARNAECWAYRGKHGPDRARKNRAQLRAG